MTKEAPPWMQPEIAAYIAERTTKPDQPLNALAETTHTETRGAAIMQISADQGALMTLITRLIGAQQAIEVGTFTGYSAICIARGLGPDGRLLCCDISEEYTSIAREAWAEAGVDDRIELRLGPALETLDSLPAGTTFDLAFVDADKENYLNYVEALLPCLRTGGLIMVDNTLWSGAVAEPADEGSTVATIQAFNDAIASDARLESYILPVGDGLTLVRKR